MKTFVLQVLTKYFSIMSHRYRYKKLTLLRFADLNQSRKDFFKIPKSILKVSDKV